MFAFRATCLVFHVAGSGCHVVSHKPRTILAADLPRVASSKDATSSGGPKLMFQAVLPRIHGRSRTASHSAEGRLGFPKIEAYVVLVCQGVGVLPSASVARWLRS